MKTQTGLPPRVLIADDDPEDIILMSRALTEASDDVEIFSVGDGEEMLKYLRGEDGYANREEYPMPDIVLLDLNMPRMDGHTALREVRRDAALRSLPIVVLSTSTQQRDIQASYEAGANSYVSKPPAFDQMVCAARQLREYWFNIAKLPQ